MDALLTAFVAAALAEWGDKSQLLLVILAARFAKPAPLIAGAAVAALLNSVIAAAGGTLIHGVITLRATSLLVAVAMLLAAVGGFIARKPPTIVEKWKLGAFATAALGLFLVEFGDKTQFLTAALAAQFDSPALAAAGAAAGITAMAIPPVLLGAKLTEAVPLRPVRIGIAILFAVAGLFVALSALRLT